ncbi:hypothetical protein NP233_g13112 [Leucocoprinus birnbaumii]|uniref:Uncharacterized protein n=1 Tax=Leucocoprinus birnbaumii TaxID=56174 RepID=A0AAD5VDH5_9AGAR|nr:hypothetical protein NP233_g13112 [Leucocoprinus birnbaumii]
MPRWQNAHCQGAEVNRRLFNHRMKGGDPSFIPGRKSNAGDLVMDAGTVQGVAVGCSVSLHQSNLLPTPGQPNDSLGTLIVTAVKSTSATLAFQSLPPAGSGSAPIPFTLSSLPRLFYCRISQRPPQSLTISSNDLQWLESTFNHEFCVSLSLTITTHTKTADLVFIRDGDVVHLDHNLNLAVSHIGTRSPYTIRDNDIGLLHRVVQCAIGFRFHLLRTNIGPSPNFDLKMEFHELRMSFDSKLGFGEKPSGRDLFEKDPAIVEVKEDKQYGLTIHNFSNEWLYPHLFYFDPSELSITFWYLPPTGAGSSSSHKTDAALSPKSDFTIGFGKGGVSPWEFILPNGLTKDVGFFKLFVTTVPADLRSILQDSPYDSSDSGYNRSGQSAGNIEIEGLWDTVLKTVVQV